jgi:PPK2 family polyphosphate:nucleotide phosphotransferase
MSSHKHKSDKENRLSEKELIESSRKLTKKYRITDGIKFRLKDYDTQDDLGLGDKEEETAKGILKLGVETLSKMQDILYAQDKWALLLIFQAMDAAGKDGVIKHVMSGINPQGCDVTSFKAPNSEELNHDYLWRCMKHIPERGRIGIFNRSYYEEVLVVRVHEEILALEKIPEQLITKDIWEERFTDIKNFEKYLNRNGVMVVKFFLNVSKKEQKKRFLDRIDNPDKNWKFSLSDVTERKYWNKYMKAYEEMIENTATEKSPWYIVPADNKSYARIVVASAIIQAMESMKLEYPVVDEQKRKELKKVKEELLSEE